MLVNDVSFIRSENESLRWDGGPDDRNLVISILRKTMSI
jgi:hypothetical protein